MIDLDAAAIADHSTNRELRVFLLQGEALSLLRALPDNSVDSLLTDPPAGVGFSGQLYDTFLPKYIDVKEADFKRSAARSGRRSSRNGRAAYSADYDFSPRGGAAFRSQMTNIFEECHRVMKPGAHGLVWGLPKTSHWTATALEDAGFGAVRDKIVHIFGTGFPKSHDLGKAIAKRAGNGWDGWGTAVKPLAEDWILVQKPIREKTIAGNVLRWGVGGLNLDGCRLDNGRRPANFILSHHPDCGPEHCLPGCPVYDLEAQNDGASRFFYCAKPSPSSRGADNHHPTVKPVGLMRYLARLVTPPAGTVLDCFMGSGTTGVAAIQEGFRFIGIDREEEYVEIAMRRIEAAARDRD